MQDDLFAMLLSRIKYLVILLDDVICRLKHH